MAIGDECICNPSVKNLRFLVGGTHASERSESLHRGAFKWRDEGIAPYEKAWVEVFSRM